MVDVEVFIDFIACLGAGKSWNGLVGGSKGADI